MNLGKQIDFLLKRHSSVFVRGLGVFSRVHTPAIFDSKRNVFLPPISLIEFDHFSSVGYDFLSYLQQVEHLELGDAESTLDSVLADIFARINQYGECTLDGLGNLVSYGNSFVFKPLDLSGFLHVEVNNDIYNESEFTESPLVTPSANSLERLGDDLENKAESVQSAAIPIEQHVDKDVPTELLKSNEEPALPVFSQEEEERVYIEPKDSNSYIYGLVAALAILVLGGIYYYATMQPNKTLIENKITVEVPLYDSSLVALDTIEESLVDSLELDSLRQDSIKKSLIEESAKKDIIIDHKYAVVIGTHKTLEQAIDEAEVYNRKGFKSVRVLQPNLSKNLKRVIWDTYPTREKRDSALREVRKHHKADAWGTEI